MSDDSIQMSDDKVSLLGVQNFFYDLLLEAERRQIFLLPQHQELVDLADFLGDRLFYSKHFLPDGFIDVHVDEYKHLQDSCSILCKISSILNNEFNSSDDEVFL